MATPKQLAALKKARAARKAKAKKAPVKRHVKRKAPANRASSRENIVTKSRDYVVGITRPEGPLYFVAWTGRGLVMDDDISKAHPVDKKMGESMRHALTEYTGETRTFVKKREAMRQTNPVPPSRVAKMKGAIDLYQDFSGNAAEYYDEINIDWPDVALHVGKVDGILYTTNRDGQTEHYIHKFKARSRPMLVASHNGKALALVGGTYRFTDRGIVDI